MLSARWRQDDVSIGLILHELSASRPWQAIRPTWSVHDRRPRVLHYHQCATIPYRWLTGWRPPIMWPHDEPSKESCGRRSSQWATRVCDLLATCTLYIRNRSKEHLSNTWSTTDESHRRLLSHTDKISEARIPRCRHRHPRRHSLIRHSCEARMAACRSACHRNNFRKSRVSDMSARILARMSVSVSMSASWNAVLNEQWRVNLRPNTSGKMTVLLGTQTVSYTHLTLPTIYSV